jgi:hypothetical protein
MCGLITEKSKMPLKLSPEQRKNVCVEHFFKKIKEWGAKKPRRGTENENKLEKT